MSLTSPIGEGVGLCKRNYRQPNFAFASNEAR